MKLRFVRSQSTETYFQALLGYLNQHGCPLAFYSDRHSVLAPAMAFYLDHWYWIAFSCSAYMLKVARWRP